MKFRTKLKAMPLIALASFAVSGLASAAQPSEPWAATHTKAPDVGLAAHIGAMHAGELVHVSLALNLRNEADLDAFNTKLVHSHSIVPLTSQQVMANYAPSEADAKAVINYLSQHGFKNIVLSQNRMLVSADGTAGAVKQAFNTEMHQYTVDGRSVHVNIADAQVPKSLSSIIKSVQGLQDLHIMRVHSHRVDPATAHNQALPSAGGLVGPISMKNFPLLYNASSLPSATSATVGIITVGSMTQTLLDLHNFDYINSYPEPTVKVITVGGASSDASGVDEWNMDSQAILAAAGGTIKEFHLYAANSYSNDALTAAINQAVTDNTAKVVNVSLGECELGAASTGMIAATDAILKIAVAQGQTFSVSAGDSGAYTCGGTGAAQSYPAVSPYVISLGGTTLYSSDPSNPGPYSDYHNRTFYNGETVWSCGNSKLCSGRSYGTTGGTGGGISLTEAAPSWQIAAGVLGTSKQRGVPDIAFDGNPNSGAAVLINNQLHQIGGTSLAAPLFAGFWARIQASKSYALPFPAVTLYQNAAANPAWFNDVTSGGNGAYHANVGWDYTTGFGSLNVANFAAGF